MSKQRNEYRGDTLTSAWTVLRTYLFYLRKNESKNGTLHTWFGSNDTMLTSPAKDDPYGGFEDYFYKLIIHNSQALEAIEEKMSARSKRFLDNYLMPGNCIAIPCNFNSERSRHKGSRLADLDTVDRMLWAVYHYFSCIENKNEIKATEYLNKLFAKINEQEASVSNFKKWLKDAEISTWEEFIKENCLEPFVSENEEGKPPISLKTGKPVPEEVEDEDYYPMPTSIDECETFFKTVNDAILERNQLIWYKCRENAAKRQSGGGTE